MQLISPPGANPGASLRSRIAFFLTPLDSRYEDLLSGNWKLNLFRDFAAGLIVAMVAIPLAMGFAMASGLRPEQGIVGGAVAGLVGALFGGSKYQVYGPTAAYIPIIGSLMAKYDHGVLVLASILAGVVLMAMGLAGMGKLVAKVPHSIVVGFTIGIAITIASSQLTEVLGLHVKTGYAFLAKAHGIWQHREEINGYAVALGLITFAITKGLLKVSPFIPAPLVGLGVSTLIASTLWADRGLIRVHEKYGAIPTDFLVFTRPAAVEVNPAFLVDLGYFVLAIVFVAAIESLLCSRMADRLADNRGVPFHPNKELWGQGLVNIAVPLLNGFPHTGALARTATNIKVGAVSPLAGIFKGVLKLLLAAFLARYLEMVPMACIGGILLFIATGMVKPAEVTQVFEHSRFHVALMWYTAVMVVLTDFLTGVTSAIVIWAILSRFFDRAPTPEPEAAAVHP
jgi:MFS superfamily sulfate permease-like transporter